MDSKPLAEAKGRHCLPGPIGPGRIRVMPGRFTNWVSKCLKLRSSDWKLGSLGRTVCSWTETRTSNSEDEFLEIFQKSFFYHPFFLSLSLPLCSYSWRSVSDLNQKPYHPTLESQIVNAFLSFWNVSLLPMAHCLEKSIGFTKYYNHPGKWATACKTARHRSALHWEFTDLTIFPIRLNCWKW